MQARAFVSAYDDLAPGHALHLRDGNHHGFAGVERIFDIFHEGLARRSKRYLAARAIEELGSDLFLQTANLRRNGRLRAKAFLRRPGE